MTLRTVLPEEKDGAKLRKAQPGSVSYGTLRTEDLIETFLDFLEEHDHPYAIGFREEYEKILKKETKEEYLEYLLNEDIWDAMQALEPDGYYFGAHPGDGADFGYWEIEED